MERIEKTVFLSYRRTNVSWALAIFQNLIQHGYDVFFDYSGIASGDFEQIIVGNIKARAHFLVLLTPSALERCDNPEDWLRREIETALAHRRNIVPVMMEGFDFSTPAIASQLTGALAALKDYNGIRIPPDYFDEAMARLRDKYLNVPLTAVLHPASRAAQRAAARQKAAADRAPKVQEEELTAQQWCERGFAAMTEGSGVRDLDELLRLFSEAIRLQPDYADAFNNRGIVRARKGDLEGALQDYSEAIRLQPDDAAAFYNRGYARHNQGDLEGALQDYSEAIRLQPENTVAFVNRGVGRRAKGDLEGALQDFNAAIRLQPDDAYAFYNRGLARHDKGDLEGALQDFSEVIRRQPDNVDAFNNRGAVRVRKGDLEGALQDFSEVIRLQPEDADAFYNRGVVRQNQGDREGALQDFSEVIRLQPDYPHLPKDVRKTLTHRPSR